MELNSETHPNWYHDIPNMTLLILGTFPPHKRSHKFNFFYPNPNNRFWNVMAHLNGKPLEHFANAPAVEERKLIMEKLNIGVQNIGSEIIRKGKSAADRNIKILKHSKNLKDIILNYPNLKNILLTGYSNEASSFKEFVKFLNIHRIPNNAPEKARAGDSFVINCGRTITCWIGNSTSRQAFRVHESDLINQFRKAFSSN